MSLEAIYASKLYKASKHKDRIKAQIDNPVNAELVQQLRGYLDDEYKTPSAVETPEVVETPHEEDLEVADTKSTTPHSAPSTPHFSAPSSGGSFAPETDVAPDENFDESVTENVGTDLEPDEVDPENPEDKDPEIESSVQVKASEEVTPNVIDVSSCVTTLLGTLNGRQDTCGVCRILPVGSNELWIYYQDTVNLNNVMEAVIALLNSSGYTFLEFNRLARTQNAIVFTINSVPSEIKPVESEES